MPDSQITALVAQIEREFGVSIPITPASDVSTVPTPLQPLYSYSDGLTLPFANIHKIADCDRTTFPNWICFGSDNYFSYFLCHHSNTPSLTTWDHEAGHDIEAVFDTVVDWLTDEYESFIDADTDDNTVQVTSVPGGASGTASKNSRRSLPSHHPNCSAYSGPVNSKSPTLFVHKYSRPFVPCMAWESLAM